MSKGYIIFASNKNDDYVRQACCLAMSIKHTQKINNVSIVTNNKVPECYKDLFDHIIEIPWVDDESFYSIKHRWKHYHVTPYEQTVNLDSDMLFFDDISHWWDLFDTKDLFFTSKVKTYRNDNITTSKYRDIFYKNNLPNVYYGFHYYRKSDLGLEFYKCLEDILITTENTEKYYKSCLKYLPKNPSMDVSSALAIKVLGIEDRVTDNKLSFPSFIHMKSLDQGWTLSKEKWQDVVPWYFNSNCNLRVQNYLQHGIFHYTENDFLTVDVENKYKKVLGI